MVYCGTVRTWDVPSRQPQRSDGPLFTSFTDKSYTVTTTSFNVSYSSLSSTYHLTLSIFSVFSKLCSPLIKVLRQLYIKRRDLITTVQWEELANALHHVLLIGVKTASSDLQVQ